MKWDQLTLILKNQDGEIIKKKTWELPADDGPYNDALFAQGTRAIDKTIEDDK